LNNPISFGYRSRRGSFWYLAGVGRWTCPRGVSSGSNEEMREGCSD